MYVPKAFAEDDAAVRHDLIEANNFGLLVSTVDGAPLATHLPFLLDRERGARGTLVAHMARANPHWQGFAAGGEALAVFTGPHAYISPAWYAGEPNVPTWNYAAVHAYGVPRLVEDPAAVAAMMERLVDVHEAGSGQPWRLASQPDDYRQAMIRGIVAFEIPVARLEGKSKLSQNKTAADRAGVVAALRDASDPQALALGLLMQARAEAQSTEGSGS